MMNASVKFYFTHFFRLYLVCLGLCLPGSSMVCGEVMDVALAATAQCDSSGIYLQDIVKSAHQNFPRIRLGNAPAWNTSVWMNRAAVLEAIVACDTNYAGLKITGAERVRVTRKARSLAETEVKSSLMETLQRTVVKERGELELRLSRPWNPVLVPDENLTFKILELPTTGVSPVFVCKFELRAGEETCGVFTVPLQARVLRDVYVASEPVMRGQSLREAKVSLEKRDILTTRDAVTELPLDNPYIEIAENIRPGTPLTTRSFRLKTVVKRGRILDATINDQAIQITARVEALEDGVPGQIVRVRNLRSKRELKGKVQDEQTITVLF